jgi:hypothetical protein
MKRVQIQLADELHKRASRMAIQRQLSLSELARRGLGLSLSLRTIRAATASDPRSRPAGLTEMKARSASHAYVLAGALPPHPRDLTHWGRQQDGGLRCGKLW